ncbi:MAG: penicillin-binding protein 2 [Endomicrobiaceae bacterium]|nr:penicillin-binding protein 2 [Endomicrobiaceae bacterium]
MKTKKRSVYLRQNFVVGFLFLLFLLIVIKLFYLQFIKHSDTDKYVDNIVNKELTEKPKRASILDRNGNILAMSVKKYTLFLDAKMIKNLSEIEQVLKSFNIEISQKQYKSIEEKKSYIPIAYNIDEYITLQIKSKKLAGLGLESKYIRQYPEGRMAAQTIGIVGSHGNGLEGIEKFCNKHLIGEEIKYKQYQIGSKKIFADKIIEDKKFEGSDVYLTIDRRLQFIAEQALEEGFISSKSKKAVAIIQNPYTGEILAMASLPNYNPEEKISDISLLRNGAISSVAEPGSTFKVVVLAGILEEKIFKSTDKINCENGKLEVAGQIIKDHEKQKIITVSQVIEYSSNIGTAKLALALGADNFYKYIKMFGFNSMTGIDLNGEEKGLLKPTSQWSKRSLHTISFGQEIATTPLQTINAFSAIANGGVLLKPKIIKSIGDKDYQSKEVIRRVISEDTAYKVRGILKNVVENGTGKIAKIKGYTVGGKTGTAQKIDRKTGKYSTKHYVASFCGMVPAINPKIVILVIFDEPQGEYYAASVAAPVFAKIAEQAMLYLNIEKDDEVIGKSKS